jgi:Tfp pilus assembly protein PilF
MKKAVVTLSLALALCLAGAAAVRAQNPINTEGMGDYKDPIHRAAGHYNRGVRAMRKAEKTKEPAEQRKLYEKAKEELAKAVGIDPNFDSTLALGQAYLALGMKESAASSCVRALALKPKNAEAKACMDATKAEQAAETPAPEGPSS